MKCNSEYVVFSLNPDKNLNGKLNIVDNPAFLNWYFGTEELTFLKYYSGGAVFRIMCKANPK